MYRSFSLLLAFCALVLAGLPSAWSKTLRFSGYDWEVRGTGKGGPGPNQWDDANVRVDEKGRLHLKISKVDGEWRCAELQTKQRFGFGRYRFQVTGRIDTFDPYVVLGLFTYPTRDVGTDGTNEIDIEAAHWGRADGTNLGYVVYPASGKRQAPGDSKAVKFTLDDPRTTHEFEWTEKGVHFLSTRGHGGKVPAEKDKAGEILRWDYAPAEARLIPHDPCPVHLNLWLFRGHAPTDDKTVEIIIDRFTYEKR